MAPLRLKQPGRSRDPPLQHGRSGRRRRGCGLLLAAGGVNLLMMELIGLSAALKCCIVLPGDLMLHPMRVVPVIER
jgi:hypothetical protein